MPVDEGIGLDAQLFPDRRLGRSAALIHPGADVTHHRPHPRPRQRHGKGRTFFLFGCSLARGTASPGAR
ncbi:MAG TPA: hypothetical protein VN886_19635 [Acidimicrobiales bacterium]|nr:hypothetical protein [Acidimicrobiales bacterium]